MAGSEEGVVILVDVDELKAAEIDLIGIKDPSATKEIGIENLRGQSFPATGGTTGENAGIGFGDHPEIRFEVRNHFVDEGVAVRTIVDRVHGVGVVVVRSGMLEGDDDHAGKMIGHPGLREFVAAFVIEVGHTSALLGGNGMVLSVETEGIAEAEMILQINDGIVRVGMIGVAFRQ